jgi:hypothetical protein
MKKIMFNDCYGLTQAVLEGRKTMTRRIAEKNLVEDMDGELCWDGEFKKPRYKVGEVVAVAQRYKDIRDIIGDIQDGKSIKSMAGWNNKMFVRADLMPHQIRITNVRVERLQDISDEDCLLEGICNWKDAPDCPSGQKNCQIELYAHDGSWDGFQSPREAFAALIDRICGRGTWKSNPWMYAYEFELIKWED